MLYGDRAWAEVNLDAIQSNILNIKKQLSADTKLMAVIKADGYGHGCLETAKIFAGAGADYFAVACLDEALLLRRHDIKQPILILGSTAEERYHEVIENDITQTLYDCESAEKLSYGKIKLNIGLVTTVRGYADEDDFTKGYVYNIKEGQTAYIPMSYEFDEAPVIEELSGLSASAGSLMTVISKQKLPTEERSHTLQIPYREEHHFRRTEQ